MMSALLKRGEVLVRERQRVKVRTVAERLRALFGATAVEAEESRIVVRGRGLIKRWLIDPNLRFLDGGLK